MVCSTHLKIIPNLLLLKRLFQIHSRYLLVYTVRISFQAVQWMNHAVYNQYPIGSREQLLAIQCRLFRHHMTSTARSLVHFLGAILPQHLLLHLIVAILVCHSCLPTLAFRLSRFVTVNWSSGIKVELSHLLQLAVSICYFFIF